MNYLYQCVECATQETADWLDEEEAKAHARRQGEAHCIFVKAEVQQFELRIENYEP